jgi:arabinofuranosyltransferase
MAPDDMFITYRYAQNLAAGRGLVFNPGERVFGVTDPGVALVLGGIAGVTGLPIPVLGTALTGAALAALAIIALLAAPNGPARLSAALGGTLVLTAPLLWAGQGSGPLIALALLASSCVAAKKAPVIAGVLAGAAVWFRPEAGVGVAIIAVMRWVESRRLPLRFSLSAGLLIGSGLLAARSYFGAYLPNTLAAKRSFAALDPAFYTGFSGFWARAINMFVDVYGGLPAVAVLLLALPGAWFFWRHGGPLAKLVTLYAASLVVVYSAVRVPFFVWYVAPILTWALFAIGALAAKVLLKARSTSLPLLAAAVIGLLFLGVPMARASYNWVARPQAGDWRAVGYRAAGEWIRNHSQPTDDIAFDEVGILAFYSDRPVRDLIGLVSPHAMPYAAQGDPLGAFLAMPTKFVVLHTFTGRGSTRPIVFRPWFPAAYEEVAALRFPELGGDVKIYRVRDASRIPPARPPRPSSRRVRVPRSAPSPW